MRGRSVLARHDGRERSRHLVEATDPGSGGRELLTGAENIPIETGAVDPETGDELVGQLDGPSLGIVSADLVRRDDWQPFDRLDGSAGAVYPRAAGLRNQ